MLREACNHNLLIIKNFSRLNKQDLNIFCEALPLWHNWLVLQWVLMILSELSKNTKSHVLLFDQGVFNYSWSRKYVSGIKSRGWQHSRNWHVNSHGLIEIMLFVWISFARASKYRTNILWKVIYFASYIHIFKVLANKHW